MIQNIKKETVSAIASTLASSLSDLELLSVPSLKDCFTTYQHSRPNKCLTLDTVSGTETLWVVYNPHTEVQELVSLLVDTARLQVLKWNSNTRKFQAVDSEAHCYDGPDLKPECELLVSASVPPFSYSILMIKTPGGSEAIKTISDTGFTVTNEMTTAAGG